MAVTFLQMNFAGQTDVNPRLGRMISTDDLETIQQPGYLSYESFTDGPPLPTDFLMTSYNADEAPSNIVLSLTFSNSGVITLSTGPNGGGNVIGPGNSDDQGLVVFAGTSGNIIQQYDGSGTVSVIDGVVFVYQTTGIGRGLINNETITETQEYLGLSGTADSLAGYGPDGTLANIGVGTGLQIDEVGNLIATGTGAGDVSGPETSTQNAIPLWNNVDGTLLQDSPVTMLLSGPTYGSLLFAQQQAVQTVARLSLSYSNSGPTYYSNMGLVGDYVPLSATRAVNITGPLVNLYGDTYCGGDLYGYDQFQNPISGNYAPTNLESAKTFVATPASTTITFTLPLSTDINIETGYNGRVFQIGAGLVQFTTQGSDTINNVSGITALTANGQAAYYELLPGAIWQLNLNIASGSGGGDVTGPETSTNNALASWGGTDGTTLLNTVVTIDPTTGSLGWTLAGTPTTQPSITTLTSSGSSYWELIADYLLLSSVSSTGLVSPAFSFSGPSNTRTLMQVSGTLDEYNYNSVYLDTGSTLNPTQLDSSNIYNIANENTAWTVTLPSINAAAVVAGTFFDFDLTGGGSSIQFAATSPDTLSNVNGQTSLTNINSYCRAIAQQYGSATYWLLLIWDKVSSGTGDVTGPETSVDGGLAFYVGTGGNTIGNAPFTPIENSLVGFSTTAPKAENIAVGTNLSIDVVDGQPTLNANLQDTRLMQVVVYQTNYVWGTPQYEVGTITVNNGDSSITGSGTAFLSTVEPGDTLILYPLSGNPAAVIVNTVLTDTGLTLTQAYNGASIAGGNYSFGPVGTVAVSTGTTFFTGTGTSFTTTLVPGSIVYVGDTQTAATILNVIDDLNARLTAQYAGTTASGAPYYTTDANVASISNANVEEGDLVFAVVLNTNSGDLTEATTNYKQTLFEVMPNPQSGVTTISYTVIRPSTGFVLPDVNTIVQAMNTSLFPNGNNLLAGTVSWTQASSPYINGVGTKFQTDFKSGDFIIMRQQNFPAQPDFCLVVSSVSSDTVMYVNATNLFGDIVNQTYMKGAFSGVGSLAASNGTSPVLTGTNTQWLSQFSNGDKIGYLNTIQTIQTVNSNTSITLTNNSPVTVLQGAYYAVYNTSTLPAAYIMPQDYLQYMEQYVTNEGDYGITSATVGTGNVTFTINDYYDADDIYVAYWGIKNPSQAQGFPTYSPLRPTTYTWNGPPLLQGYIAPFANGVTALTGSGTAFQTDLTVGKSLIVYVNGLNGTYTLPWVAQIGSISTQTALSVTNTESPVGSGYSSYAVGAQPGNVGFVSGSTNLVGVGTSFTTDFAAGDLVLYSYTNGVGTGVSEYRQIVSISSDLIMVVDQPFIYTASGLGYCKAWSEISFAAPAIIPSDSIFGNINTQGSGARVVNNMYATNSAVNIALSTLHCTNDVVINAWGQRSIGV